jgi:outer membrane protein assembly factor BamB
MVGIDADYCPTCGSELGPVEREGCDRRYCEACDEVVRRNPPPTTGVAVRGGDRVLMAERGPPREGWWTVPGGFLEYDEPAPEGAARELEEEVSASGTSSTVTSRRAFLATGVAALTAGCQAVGDLLGDEEETMNAGCGPSQGWHQYQVDAANSGRQALRVPSFDAEPTTLGGVEDFVGGVAVDAERRVFVSDEQEVWAVDADEERELWRRLLDAPVSGTPILGCDAVVVQTYDGTHALKKTDGSTIWEAGFGQLSGDPLADGRRIFVASDVPAALDVVDGTDVWTQDAVDLDPWGCCLGDGVLVVAGQTDGGGALVGLDAESGEHMWRTDLQRGVKTSPTFADGTVYVPDKGNGLVAVSTDSGDVEWQTDPYARIANTRRATTPTVVGETVVVSSGNGPTTVGVDRASGETRWELDTGPTLAPPLATESGVLVGAVNEGLFLVDPDGTLREHKRDTRVGSQMALTEAGLFYQTGHRSSELVHLAG